MKQIIETGKGDVEHEAPLLSVTVGNVTAHFAMSEDADGNEESMRMFEDIAAARAALNIAIGRAKIIDGMRWGRAVALGMQQQITAAQADDRLMSGTFAEIVNQPNLTDRAQRHVELWLTGAGWQPWSDPDGQIGQPREHARVIDIDTGRTLIGKLARAPFGIVSDIFWFDEDDTDGDAYDIDTAPHGRWWIVFGSTPGEWPDAKLPFDPYRMRQLHDEQLKR